jgi:hypothetical protein
MNDNDSHRPPGGATLLLFRLALLCVSAGAGGCLVSVDVEAPDVEVTQRGLTFAGVPPIPGLGDVSTTRTFSQKHAALDLPKGLTSEVKALEVSLTANQGVTDFAFIRALRLTMSDASDNANAIELINYEKDPASAPSAILTMTSANPVNALEKWKTDAALFTVEVAGALPSSDWAADVTIHFAGKFHYQR